MNRKNARKPLSIALGVLLSTGCVCAAVAQDSFGQQPPPQQQSNDYPPTQQGNQPQQWGGSGSLPPQGDYGPQPPPPGYDGNGRQPMQGASNEAQDFGVAPTQQLRPTQQLHGPTPTSIPGGRVINTQQLAQLLQGGQGKVMVLDVFGGPQHLPGAVPVLPAAQGGSFDDQVQQGFGQYLRQATGGDTSRMLVLYCGGVQCWSSYNAALRAMKLGYRNVAWYRGGIEAWQQAGLPLQSAGGPGPQTQAPQPPSGGRQW